MEPILASASASDAVTLTLDADAQCEKAIRRAVVLKVGSSFWVEVVVHAIREFLI